MLADCITVEVNFAFGSSFRLRQQKNIINCHFSGIAVIAWFSHFNHQICFVIFFCWNDSFAEITRSYLIFGNFLYFFKAILCGIIHDLFGEIFWKVMKCLRQLLRMTIYLSRLHVWWFCISTQFWRSYISSINSIKIIII